MSTQTMHEALPSRVAVIGSRAAQALARGDNGAVMAVFERSVHIAVDDAFICVGGPGIGNGPLNAIVHPPFASRWPVGIEPSEPVEIAARQLKFRSGLLDCRDAQIWRPQPWPQPASPRAMRSTLDRVAAIARARAPPEGLSRAIIDGGARAPATCTAAIERVAIPRIQALRAWLGDRIGGTGGAAFPPAQAVGLLGLGPGLTPSGDDVLCGVLLGLHAIGATAIASELAGSVLSAAPLQTTPLSRALLAASAEGEGGEALHRFIAAASSASADQLDCVVENLGRIGHTSGWDALAGAFLVLSAYAVRHPPTRSP